MNDDERRLMLTAYALTQLASIQEAMQVLGAYDQMAKAAADGMDRLVTRAALDWALSRELVSLSLPAAEQVPVLVNDARNYLAAVAPDLEALLAEMQRREQ